MFLDINVCICQLIFKIFVAHFMTNLVLNIKKIFILPLKKQWIIPEISVSEVKNNTLGTK